MRTLLTLTAACILYSATASAQADQCGASASEVAEDLFDAAVYPQWSCGAVLVDDVWSRFHMQASAWQRFGIDDPCNLQLPLGRTFNALNVLNFAGTSTPDCDVANENWLLWASCYTASSIRALVPECSGPNPSITATTYWGDGEPNPRTELRRAWFYSQAVPLRASDLVHEARHADGWCAHTDRCAAGPGACDPSFEQGCVGRSTGKGAYAYTVMYDWWYGVQARPEFTNASITAIALDDARARLTSNFEADPCFTIDSAGARVTTC